jgi:glycosyltransferase involved in cell wall biosynthesis
MQISVALITIIIFSALALIQIFYYLFFFLRLGIYKNKFVDDNTKGISLIICAQNESRNIAENIQSWCTQKYNGSYEVIIVDDNSDDDSDFLYNDIKLKYNNLRIIRLTQEAKGIKGKKFPLSIGIKEAKFDNVLLTDADCKPQSEFWLQKMSNAYLNNKSIVLGYSPFNKYKGFLNKRIRWDAAFTAIQYLSYAIAKVPYMGVGRNLSYHKELFFSNKGFSSHAHLLSGDDDLFINQVANSANTAIQIDEDTFVYTEPKHSYETWIFQKKRHLSTGKYYKSKHKTILGIYNATHFLFFITLIPSLFFPKFWIVVISVFLARWVIQYITITLCLKKLQEHDLIPSIWLFDIITFFYNLRMAPFVFKNPNKWK